MSLFEKANEKTQEANALRKKAIGQLKEGSAAQVTTVTRGIGSDSPKATQLNIEGGFKITSSVSKAKIKAAKIRRKKAINAPKKKASIVNKAKNSKRLESFYLKTVKKDSKNRGLKKGDVLFSISGVV